MKTLTLLAALILCSCATQQRLSPAQMEAITSLGKAERHLIESNGFQMYVYYLADSTQLWVPDNYGFYMRDTTVENLIFEKK